MITHDAVEANLRMAHMLLHAYIEDFTDEELLVRPVAGANHVAWQLGHLICSEYSIISQVAELPRDMIRTRRRPNEQLLVGEILEISVQKHVGHPQVGFNGIVGNHGGSPFR